MAAATRPPGFGDARVPCPLCGGLIHPVAGRCKHCKEDLTAFRAGRPQAAAPLPALYAGQPGQPGQPGPHVATFVAPVVATDAQPILPQRPTGRSMAAQQPRSLLRNWPMLVIAVAVLAIVGAVVVMVMPIDSEQSGTPRKLMPAPAPDRMDTNPMPQQHGQLAPGGDPWQTSPDPSAGRQPRRAPSPPGPSVPDDPDDLDDLSSSFDDLGSVGALGSLGGRGGMQGTFMMTLLHQGCQKLLSCPNTSVTLGPLCSQFSALPRPPVPQNCPSAQRCLDQIQRIDCDAGLDSPLQALALFDDCSRAATEC